jgi:D-alanine-D-alanine ligase-like ATP-grasp enzyme
MHFDTNMKKPYMLGEIFARLAPTIDATVEMEDEWGMAGMIRFKNGKKSFFRYNSVDLNPLGASKIATDKDFANYFMRLQGYPVVEGETFFRDDWADAVQSQRRTDAACAYAATLGFPCIVKPNSMSQGTAVSKVESEAECREALARVFAVDRIALVQRYVRGEDYRVVVLDDAVISAYQRIPLSIVGDGVSTIAQLLVQKQEEFIATGRDTVLNTADPRMAATLARQSLTLESIPAEGEKLFLLDNANLSTGGDSVDVTSLIHPEYKRIAVAVTKDMGLRHCGVDLLITQGTISNAPADGSYVILEINDTPGLDHYAASGEVQRKVVEDMYMQVLLALEKQ